MKLFPLILIGTIAEILVWIGVAKFISGWYVFFWFIIAFVIGLNMIRSSASAIMPQLQQMQMTGQMGTDKQVSKKLAMVMSGFLLMIPGLISDVLALLILIPGVQSVARQAFMKYMAKKQQAMMSNMMGDMNQAGDAQHPFADLMRQMQDMQNAQGRGQYGDSDIIDGEAREVEPERQQIEVKDVRKE
ncbi:FxsA family protein [Acinetobacter sp. WZC-1]|uniref:FxsA family protein n=1 Tax=Acinetobacter sp. WZC-1 TaxID=3459034 RepID=UPI00403DD65B